MNSYLKYKFYICENSSYSYVDGIESLEIQKNFSIDNNYFLGGIKSLSSPNAASELSFSIQRSLINCDQLLKYTGDLGLYTSSLFDGFKYYNIEGFSYLQKYSANFTIGDLPKINYQFINYGNFNLGDKFSNGNITTTNTIGNTQLPQNSYSMPSIIQLSGITLSGFPYTDFSINSIQYSATINRSPLYSIGNMYPDKIHTIMPINIDMSISAKIKDENLNSIRTNHYNSLASNLNFEVYLKNSNSTQCFPIKNAQLVGTNLNIQNSTVPDIVLNFKGFYGI